MINNTIVISGKVVRDLEFSHRVFEDEFYKGKIEIKRLSEEVDILNFVVPSELKDLILKGEYYTFKGQLRSYNKQEKDRIKLILTVFVKQLVPLNAIISQNDITLIGYICKEPIYRTTPFNRQICDVLLAVNRSYNKSDYIPCITWGTNAYFTSKLPVSKKVCLKGGLQSREYNKVDKDGSSTKMTAYEVSVRSIEVL